MFKPILNRVTRTLIISSVVLTANYTLFTSSYLYAKDSQTTPKQATSSAIQNWQVLPDTINKSPADNREYQAIRLENGLTVLLVSDPQATFSLGALALPIGSLDDPRSQQGLAHYLEHMVLMGSKHYPEPSGFSEFLKKHGGRHNASTASFRTSFYFEVEDQGLNEALDRLADAISAPLLDPTNADKERNAVNAELTMARARDGMRMAQVDSETINPEHPSSKFFGGNLETLSDKPDSKLQDALQAFYQTHYSSNYMVGVIYSPRPLKELAQLAANTYGKISNKNAQVPQITTPVVTEKERGIIIHYVPAQPLKQLKLEFRIPEKTIDPNNQEFLEKTDTLIGYLIGNRSENTLASWLQNEGYIEDINAGAYLEQDRNGGVFTIAASLTDKGLANRDTVIAAIFNYLNLIEQEGIQARYFDEIKNVLATDFRFPSLTRDMDYVEELADNLLTRPVAHVLDADYATSQFNPEAVKKRLVMLTPENARIWFISPDEPHNKTAYFVEAPYQVEKISNDRFSNWQKLGQSFKFNLPVLNPYIPTDFSLVSENHALKGEESELRRKEHITIPTYLPASFLSEIIHQPELANAPMRVYAMKSEMINLMFEPKANINVILRETAHSSADKPELAMQKQISLALIDYLAGLELKQLTYQASVAGIEFSTGFDNGLAISANGYTQHLMKLLVEVLKSYKQIQPTEAQFAQAKSWYINQLLSADRVKPFELAIQPLQSVSKVPYFEREARRELVEKLTLKDVMAFHDKLFADNQLNILSVGNLSREQIAQLASSLKAEKIWQYDVSLATSAEPSLTEKQLLTEKQSLTEKQASTDSSVSNTPFSFGKNVVIEKPLTASLSRMGETSDSALAALYIPLEDSNKQILSDEQDEALRKQQAKALLLSDIVQPWFYDELRSNQQLGYAVFTSPYAIGKQWGILFLLQSNIKQPADLYTQYLAFYNQAKEKFAKLTDAEFKEYKKGTLAKLQEPPQTLDEEAARYAQDFSNGNAYFDSRRKLIQAVNSLTLEDVKAFYEEALFGKNHFVGISQVSGTEQAPAFAKPEGAQEIKNSSTLQNMLNIQPILPRK